MKNNEMPLSYDDALTGVFLRTLAWELYVANGKPSVRDIAEQYVQSARGELGLKKTTKGAPHAFIHALRKHKFMDKISPTDDRWKDAWRLLYLPSHRLVRVLSNSPVVQQNISNFPSRKKPLGVIQYSVSLRSPALPKLLVTIGNGRPENNQMKGLYFLREPKSLYVGQTDEFQTRWNDHVYNSGREVCWWVFVAPEEKNDDFPLEALNAAESLLISFWSEICKTTNKKRGKDKKPPIYHLQQAVLFVEAASATLLWLMRDKKKELKFENWDLPFKDCRANHWPDCYLQNPLNP